MPATAIGQDDVTRKMRLGTELQRVSLTWFNKGVTLCTLGRFEEALTCYDRALALDTRNARIWYNKGLTLAQLGRSTPALEAYERALRLAPDKAFIWQQEGLTLSQLGRDEQALVAFERAISLAPRDALTWQHKGAALHRLGRYDEALAAYDRTLALDSDRAVVWGQQDEARQVEVRPHQTIQMAALVVPTSAAPERAATPASASVRPALAADVKLLGPMKDTGFKQQQWLVQRGTSLIQLTELLYRVVECVDGQRTLEEIARLVSQATGRNVSVGNIEHLLRTRLVPAHLIAGPEGLGVPAQQAAPPPVARSPLSLTLRVAALGPRTIDLFARVLQYLYLPVIMIPLLAAVAVSQWWLFERHGFALALRQLAARPELGITVWVLIFASTVFHEFGHAAALRRGGGRARSIGFGFYLVTPALYTDITDNYRLGRWARVRTDLGGFYFNLIFSLGLTYAFVLTHQEFLLLAVLATDADILFQLQPFVRFDGYWALADLTGVPDFFTQMGPFLRSKLPFLKSSGRKLPPLKGWVQLVFGLYIIVTVPMLVFTFASIFLTLPSLLSITSAAMLAHSNAFVAARTMGDVAGMGVAVGRMALLALPLLGVVLVMYSLGRMVLKLVQILFRGSLVRRVVVAAGALAMVFLLLFLTIPQTMLRFVGMASAHAATTSAVHGALATASATARPAWRQVAGLETARCCLTAAAGHDGRVYAIGGYDQSALNTVEVYSPAANAWTYAPPMQTTREFPAAVAGPDGRIYVMGGFDGSHYLRSVEAYDPRYGTWAYVAPMQEARAQLAASVGPDGRIYAIGGYNGSRTLATVEAYAPESDTWTSVAPMPTARALLATAAGPDGRVYAIGGTASGPLGTVEAYSPRDDAWSVLTPLPSARDKLAAALGGDGRIYAIGGYDGTRHLASVVAFAPGSDRWTDAPSLSGVRWELAAASMPNGAYLAIGGTSPDAGSSSAVEVYR